MKQLKVFLAMLTFALFFGISPSTSRAEECNLPTGGCFLGLCVWGDMAAPLCPFGICPPPTVCQSPCASALGGASMDHTPDLTDINSCLVGPRQPAPKCGGACGAPTPNVCGEEMCPTAAQGAGYNGATCEIDADSDNTGVKCSSNGSLPRYGTWDASQGACITCDLANKEINRIGWGTGNFFCNGDATGLQTGLFDSACGADASCDEKSAGDNCGGTKTCNATGICVATAGLVLTAAAAPTSIPLSATSTITFTVTKTAVAVNGVTVSGIAVTAGLGGVSAASCVTAGAGTCTVTYTAPAAATIATISATKASNGVDTDSGPASTNVAVSPCVLPQYSSYDDNPYNLGDLIQADGWNTNNFSLCIYNTPGNLQNEGNFCGAPVPKSITFVSNLPGTWKSLSVPGCAPGTCPDPFNVTAGCPGSTEIIAAACPACGNGDCDCGETNATCAADCPPVCVPSGPENCAVAGDEDCNGAADCADLACPDGTICSGTNFCDTGACVECTTSNLSNCAADEVCNAGTCTPCTGDGTAAASANLCCIGLNWIGGICTSACDPSVSFFCNPLRGTVEDVVQGGQKLIGYVLGLIGSIALLFIVIAGMMYMTSAGNEERIASSKRILTGSIIGIAITLLAYSFLQVIMSILNM